MNTYQQVNDVLEQFTTINRIAFMFSLNESHPDEQYFVDGKSFFNESFVTNVCNVINNKHVTNLDFLACNTLQHDAWKNLYTEINSRTGVIIGASNDSTGNIKYGGDWVLESTNQDVQLIYFTSDIGYLKYVLDATPNIQRFKIIYTHDTISVNVYVLFTIDVNNWTGNGFWTSDEELAAGSGGGTMYPYPSWIIDCKVYIDNVLAYSLADINEITLFSYSDYPFGDPENPMSIVDGGSDTGFAIWTYDHNIFDMTWWNLMSVGTLGITDDSMYISNIINLEFVSYTCFPAKTLITTNQGDIPIERLNPKYHTIRNKPIVAISKTVFEDDQYLVCFEKDSLGSNVPSVKTTISKNHKIFYKGNMIPAWQFLQLKNVSRIEYKGEVLYNVLMDSHDKMMVHNLICETLDPKTDIAKYCIMAKKLDNANKLKLMDWYNSEYKKRKTLA